MDTKQQPYGECYRDGMPKSRYGLSRKLADERAAAQEHVRKLEEERTTASAKIQAEWDAQAVISAAIKARKDRRITVIICSLFIIVVIFVVLSLPALYDVVSKASTTELLLAGIFFVLWSQRKKA